MKKYFDLSINEKINLKMCAIISNNNKRLHFRTPVALSSLNELQIHILLN
jgi:hypothetical protein